MREAFLLIFSIVGLLLCEQNSILEGFSSGVKLTIPVFGNLLNEVGHIINNSQKLLYLLGTCELI